MQSLIRALRSQCKLTSGAKICIESASKRGYVTPLLPALNESSKFCTNSVSIVSSWRNFCAATNPVDPNLHKPIDPNLHEPIDPNLHEPIDPNLHEPIEPEIKVRPRVKFKRPDKTARQIMLILDKEAVQEVKGQREIPNIRPGYIIELKMEVPENKRRLTTIKGIVIARRNAGLNTTIRVRRLVAGVGVESLLPLYSPNIKEFKILEKKKVRRAKLYYLRDRMNPLKK